MKTKFLFFLFISLIFLNSLSCKKQSDSKILISATIYPLYDVIKNVAGDRAEVNLIVSPGSSPHTFAPKPSVMKKIAQAKAVFMIGLGLEIFMEKIKSQNVNGNFIELGKKLKTFKFAGNVIEAEEEHHAGRNSHSNERVEHHGHAQEHAHSHEHGHSHGEGVDPHVWLDPVNVSTMTDLIAAELSHIDPAGKSVYEKNAEIFKEKLAQLDKKIREIVKSFKSKNIITFHDAFGYFAKRYGMNVAASFEPWPGKEPSVKYRKKLVDVIKKLKAVALFYEPQFNPSALKSLAEETGVRIGLLDPIGSPDIAGRSNYISLMEFNLQSLKETMN